MVLTTAMFRVSQAGHLRGAEKDETGMADISQF
jgi:hypothetical protein